MRYVSVRGDCNRGKKNPAWIAFDIQTLLNIQFISSKMDFFFLPGKTASILFSFFHYSFSIKDYVNVTLL